MKYLSLIVFISASAFADIEIQESSIQESFTKTVEVSGTFLHGIQLHSDSKDNDLHVYFPTPTTGKLCIDISAIDGRYNARLEHDLNEEASGMTRIVFPSAYSKEISGYNNESLAVHSAIKERCDRNAIKNRLVSSWSKTYDNKLILLIRSSATTDVASVEGENGYRCRKIKNAKNVAFDKQCEIPNFNINASGKIIVARKNLQPIRPKKIKFN